MRKSESREHGVLGFLKKGMCFCAISVHCSDGYAAGHHHDNASYLIPPDAQSSPTSSELLKRISTSMEQLKNQHSALSKTFQSYPTLDTSITSLVSSPALPTTTEEEDEVHTPSTATAGQNRMSLFSSHSGDGSVWFDAPEYDGPEEFVLDVSPPEDQGQLYYTDSRMTERTDVTEATEAGSSTGVDTDSESESEEEVEKSLAVEPAVIQRRTSLPSGPVGDEGSLFAVLKKNVGKVRDSSERIGVPVF